MFTRVLSLDSCLQRNNQHNRGRTCPKKTKHFTLFSLTSSPLLIFPSWVNLSPHCVAIVCTVIVLSFHQIRIDWRAGVCVLSLQAVHMLACWACPWLSTVVFTTYSRQICACHCVPTGTACPLVGASLCLINLMTSLLRYLVCTCLRDASTRALKFRLPLCKAKLKKILRGNGPGSRFAHRH